MPCGILVAVTPALLLLAAALAAPTWWTTRGRVWWLLPVIASGVVGLAALAVASGWVPADADPPVAVIASAGMLASVSVGGPLTVAVLRGVSGRTDLNEPGRHEAQLSSAAATEADDVLAAADVLRGGAWIGALERVAVTATLVAGWPEGLAVVLAVKGLGRYPELRRPGAAERFIIGTFTSVLWAAGCAGVVTIAVR